MHSFLTRLASGALMGAALVLVAPAAQAHFDLLTPASWSVDNQNTGAPEKLGPCGNEGTPVLARDDAGQPIVTVVQEGATLTVTIDEVVPHPGHYRISLSTDWADAGDTLQSGFPADPMVSVGKTNSGTMVCAPGLMSNCGSVPIVAQTPVQVPGVGWILADNVFEHCAAFTKPQTTQITLPPGVTCKECVIQVLEFMSDHGLNTPGGCFYHHCANVSISGDAGSAGMSGGTASGASSGAASGVSSGTVASGAIAGTGSAAGTGATTGAAATTGSATTGSLATTGAGSTGSAAGAVVGGSGTATGASTSGTAGGGGMTAPPPTAKTGCSISPRGASFGAALAGLALAMGMIRRKRR
jgi:Lytic polysaccharide mono-oxygenase, cellulose-degrading